MNNSKHFFYGRISSSSQSKARQLNCISENNLNIDERDIFFDVKSGKNFNREQYLLLKHVIRAGDVIFVKSLDRFGRNYQEILEEWRDITSKGVDIVVLDMPLLDTRQNKDLLGNFISNLILEILSYVSEQERIFIRDLFIQYAKEKEWSIYDFYVDVESGTSTKRKELNRLIKDAEARKINVLVAKELSRLARNVELSHKIKRIAETNNVHIVTLDGAINTLEGNGNMFGLYAWIYEQEAQRTSERIKIALRSRAELGLFNGSVAPYGYECIDSKLYIRNDDTPNIVKRIFSEYINGKGIDTIARHLYNEGIPTPAMIAGKSNKNDKWHGRTIQLILRNQAYLGHMIQLKQSTVSVVSRVRHKTSIDKQAIIKNTHEPIISEEDFKLVQELMKVRTHKNHHQALHLFTNIIYCADCGKGMHFKKNRKGYVCGTFNKHGSKACSSHIVREANLSIIVLSEIKQFVADIKTTDLYDNFKLKIDNEILKHKNALKSYEDDLIILKKRKSKSISMLIDEIITKSDYELFITDIDEQVKSLEHKIVITKQALEKISDSLLLNELNRIKNEELSLDELTPELLHCFVKKIDIEEDGTPIISYGFIMPFPH